MKRGAGNQGERRIHLDRKGCTKKAGLALTAPMREGEDSELTRETGCRGARRGRLAGSMRPAVGDTYQHFMLAGRTEKRIRFHDLYVQIVEETYGGSNYDPALGGD